MATSQFDDEIGCWKKEKILGTGGFGYVVLWRNKETNDTIALKECRWGHDPAMTPKHRNRWKLEVDIMSRLNHPNVVTAIPVPPELDVPPTELPLLAMEFCNNGDLRKLLSRPENCCGLKEKHVRLVMKHISSAVNYLHSMRIIHRDLKPENIVIQSQNGSVVYKLIDLGYAKELDQGSLCTSFVGTLQYLAPELFMSQKYSCTVDYWSLGLLTHEIITGARPFLPDKSPAEWIPVIRQKTSTQIRAYLDDTKNIVFSSEIAPFNHISSIFKQEVEKWLRLMLDWDPKKRGRNEETNFLSLLDKILNIKIAFVFCVETLKFHCLTITEGLTLRAFFEQLETLTGIPVSQQEIILANGLFPDSSKCAEQFISNMEEEEYVVYLFDSKNTPVPLPSSVTFISPNVENMMRNPKQEVDYITQRCVWSEAVYLCQQECMRTSKILNALKVYVTSLIAKNSSAHKNVSRLTTEMNQLMTGCSFLKSCLQHDIKEFKKQQKKGHFAPGNMLKKWENILQNLEQVEFLKKKIIDIETSFSNLSTQAMLLHKSPLARSKCTAASEEIYEKVLDSFSELRKRPKEKRRISYNNIDFVRLLCICLHHNHSSSQELLSQIREVKQVKSMIDDKLCDMVCLVYEIKDWGTQIEQWQSQRQQDIWNLIDSLNYKAHNSKEAISPTPNSSCHQVSSINDNNCNDDSLKTVQTSPAITRRNINNSKFEFPKSRPLSVVLSPPVIVPPSHSNDSIRRISANSKEYSVNNGMSLSSTSITGNKSLSAILDQAAKDNQRVRQENRALVESFQALMDHLQSYKDSDVTETLK